MKNSLKSMITIVYKNNAIITILRIELLKTALLSVFFIDKVSP
jgi:hypothetical protein